MNDKEVLTLCVAQDGAIWIGTDGGGLNVYKDGKNSRIYSSDTGEISSLTYLSSLKDSEQNLWFGSAFMGIDIYRSGEKRFSHYQPRIRHAMVFALFEDDKRNIWIGTDYGIEVYNLQTREKSFLHTGNSKLPTDQIRSFSQDKKRKSLDWYT